MAGAPPLLRLKDLLELDCDSCSAAGFRCYPRRLGESSAPAMRRLLDSPSPSLRRHPTSKLSSLSRTISRRLGFFWRLRDEDDAAVATPRGSSGSESRAASSPTTSDNSSGRSGSRFESDSDFSTATISSASHSMDAATVMATADGDEHEAMKRGSSSSGSEEAEQLSPVAVMDFPFDDDEGEDAGACSPSPSFSLARLKRRKMLRTQHMIRRFESAEELGPVNLEALLAATSDFHDLADDVSEQRVTQRSTEDVARPSRSRRGAGVRHEPDEHDGLLALLMDAGMGHVTKRLLVDFFVEIKRRRGGSMEHWGELSSAPAGLLLLPREAERLGDSDVLAAARGWLDGEGSERWGLNDVLRGGRALVAEMERGRRWMQVGEEEREVGVVVAGMLVDQLVDEVVWDLLV